MQYKVQVRVNCALVSCGLSFLPVDDELKYNSRDCESRNTVVCTHCNTATLRHCNPNTLLHGNMVQFSNYPRPRDYWKLRDGRSLDAYILRHELETENFFVFKNTSKSRLMVLFVRCQRGLPSYEGTPLRDLKRYAVQRALPPPAKRETTLGAAKARLEQADDEATFDRFSDLPPELRQMIYAFYFKSFHRFGLSIHKNQPPITRASRETRRESLPLFYEYCDFAVITATELHWLPQYNVALTTTSRDWVKATSAENFGRIKSISLEIPHKYSTFKLGLNNRENPISVAWGLLNHSQSPDPTVQERKDRLLFELRTIAMGIAAREGPLKLRKGDLEEMYETIRRVLGDLTSGPL